ncbi:hypothetical protein AALP_AA5G125500 [Arabis alpina]|uniref:Uncharacterized protein n=1 Tax=Arabis alpina TaxID=50452 RepID=A0A087GWN5_ARAAL|nr:hypothetical protein AALP_AA5G125500 [Arabis alpina]
MIYTTNPLQTDTRLADFDESTHLKIQKLKTLHSL